MLDIRPVAYVIGVLLLALGVTMLGPMLADLSAGNGQWWVFAEAAALTMAVGGLTALAASDGVAHGLNLRQGFLVASLVWLILPAFGAIPFMLGATEARPVDALFEAMSAMTTTGSTVFTGLQNLPEGILLWRGIMQWLGGIGIIVMAMVFLPDLRVGGMQVFRSEAFETLGKILPRAAEIASRISVIYVGLTVACALIYMGLEMTPFDAVVHAMSTLATGGMANSDASFFNYGAGVHYVAVAFMFLSALPYVRFVQLAGGAAGPLFSDRQIWVFGIVVLVSAGMLAAAQAAVAGALTEVMWREALFNTVSIITGTGFASADYMQWGPFAITLIFFIGLIGGCAGSTSCSIKVFRYQILFSAIRAQIRQLHSPSGVFVVRFEGRPVTPDALNSVMAFFVVFVLSLGIVAVLLSLTGLDFITSVSGAATALANIGPGLGSEIGPTGNFAGLNDTAKWILTAAMFVGRLEMMVVLVLIVPRFWRA